MSSNWASNASFRVSYRGGVILGMHLCCWQCMVPFAALQNSNLPRVKPARMARLPGKLLVLQSNRFTQYVCMQSCLPKAKRGGLLTSRSEDCVFSREGRKKGLMILVQMLACPLRTCPRQPDTLSKFGVPLLEDLSAARQAWGLTIGDAISKTFLCGDA